MNRKDLPKMKMQSFDDLFGMHEGSTFSDDSLHEKEGIVSLPLAELREFQDHPFRVQDDEKMQELMDSIREYGVIHPGIVRMLPDGGYELISGHRRKYACRKLGMTSMPVRILDLDDDEAAILMVQTNFSQREVLLPSEKAKGYRREFDARKHQGSRGGYTATEIGEAMGDSISTVKRFIKLSYLTDGLLDLLDEKKIGLEHGYDLAFLSTEQQEIVLAVMKETKVRINKEQSAKLREYGAGDKLNDVTARLILTEKSKREKNFTIRTERLQQYFSEDYSDTQITEIIFGLLDQWKEANQA